MSYPVIITRTCAYQGVRNILENPLKPGRARSLMKIVLCPVGQKCTKMNQKCVFEVLCKVLDCFLFRINYNEISSKLEHLSNWERCFLFHFKSSFRSQENQILEFYILKFHDVIKCLSIKQEIHFTQ